MKSYPVCASLGVNAREITQRLVFGCGVERSLAYREQTFAGFVPFGTKLPVADYVQVSCHLSAERLVDLAEAEILWREEDLPRRAAVDVKLLVRFFGRDHADPNGGKDARDRGGCE